MQSGYIAFLDVLGFREIVESKLKEEEQGKFGSSSAFFDRYLGTITEALDTGSGGLEPVDLIVFSDCILLVTDGGGEPALQSLLIRCSRISGLLLQKGIAVRGAIHCGPMLRKSMSAGVFAAGPAIIQAYDLEEEQNWT